MTSSTHTRNEVTSCLSLVTTLESPPRPPLPLLPPPLTYVTVPITTLAEPRTCASQAPSALATDKTTAVVSQDADVPGSSRVQRRPASTAASPTGFPPSASSRIFGRRSDTATSVSASSTRASSPPVTKFHGAVPATGSCPSSAAPPHEGTGAYALSAAPLSYSIDHATGADHSGAAHLSQDTGAHAPSAPPPEARAAQSSTSWSGIAFAKTPSLLEFCQFLPQTDHETHLLNTGAKASPFDPVGGIGPRADDPTLVIPTGGQGKKKSVNLFLRFATPLAPVRPGWQPKPPVSNSASRPRPAE